jgi:hypothetical protein
VCCDLDVMGVLGCEPAAYAQMLVDVLRRGRTLRAMAPSMGVRAVEVTFQRLEQVMGYEQGVRGRRWMRAAAGVVGAMLILPGATMVAARGEAVAATEAAATTTAPVEALVLPDPTPVAGLGKKAVIVAGLKKAAAGNPKWMNRQNLPNVGVKKVAPAVLLPEVPARKKRAG